MIAQDFIGRKKGHQSGEKGSRDDQVEKVCQFLAKNQPGYCKVVGAWGLGKTYVITRALEEVGVSKFYTLKSKAYITLGLEGMCRVITGDGDNKRSRRHRARFSVIEEIDRLNDEIERSARPGKKILLWVCLSGLDENHRDLVRICDPSAFSASARRWSIRKFIFESHQEIEPDWDNYELVREMVKILRFEESEVEQFLVGRLGRLLDLDSSGNHSVARDIVCRYVGYHPELLRRLCEKLCSLGQRFIAARLNGKGSFEDKFDPQVQDLLGGISKDVWSNSVKRLVDSLSIDALKSLLQGEYLLNAGPRVFISYQHEDRDFVDSLRERLAAIGARPFVDTHEMKPGDSILQSISRELSRADFFLVVLSKSSVESRWVNEEIDGAFTAKNTDTSTLKIIPVLKEMVEVPLLLRSRVWADLSVDFDAGFQILAQSLLGAQLGSFHMDLHAAGLVVLDKEKERPALLLQIFRSLVEKSLSDRC